MQRIAECGAARTSALTGTCTDAARPSQHATLAKRADGGPDVPRLQVRGRLFIKRASALRAEGPCAILATPGSHAAALGETQSPFMRDEDRGLWLYFRRVYMSPVEPGFARDPSGYERQDVPRG
jgi:hypothetical protein